MPQTELASALLNRLEPKYVQVKGQDQVIYRDKAGVYHLQLYKRNARFY